MSMESSDLGAGDVKVLKSQYNNLRTDVKNTSNRIVCIWVPVLLSGVATTTSTTYVTVPVAGKSALGVPIDTSHPKTEGAGTGTYRFYAWLRTVGSGLATGYVRLTYAGGTLELTSTHDDHDIYRVNDTFSPSSGVSDLSLEIKTSDAAKDVYLYGAMVQVCIT